MPGLWRPWRRGPTGASPGSLSLQPCGADTDLSPPPPPAKAGDGGAVRRARKSGGRLGTLLAEELSAGDLASRRPTPTAALTEPRGRARSGKPLSRRDPEAEAARGCPGFSALTTALRRRLRADQCEKAERACADSRSRRSSKGAGCFSPVAI